MYEPIQRALRSMLLLFVLTCLAGPAPVLALVRGATRVIDFSASPTPEALLGAPDCIDAVVAIHGNSVIGTILAVTENGVLFEGRTDDAWMTWSPVGVIPGLPIVDLTQDASDPAAAIVVFTADGRVFEVDPRRLHLPVLRTDTARVGVKALIANRFDDTMLAVTEDGIVYQGRSDDAWLTWTQVSVLAEWVVVESSSGGPAPLIGAGRVFAYEDPGSRQAGTGSAAQPERAGRAHARGSRMRVHEGLSAPC